MTPPYYIVPLVEEYKTLDPHSDRARSISRKIAANVGDIPSLRLILGIDPPEFAKFYPDLETPSPSTFDTIDSFLDKFGKELPPAGYIPDFENPESQRDQSFLSEEQEPGQSRSSTDYTSLALLMKQRRYHEALEFINSQNLNNPKKSIYFAHQIRFLKKLIALDNFINRQV